MSRLAAERVAAHELADLADELTLATFGRWDPRTAGRKDDGTYVTATDREVEERLRERLRARFPDHAVLGEEGGLDGPQGAPTWVLDPIDGTTGFVRGTPVWATLIGLRIDGVDVLGVVSAPALGSRWDGVAGHGARRDGRAVTVSPVTELTAAEVSFGGLRHFPPGQVDRLVAATARQRAYGDFWHHCLVAQGSIELAVEAVVSPWDLVAVRAVVAAAGGRSTDLRGRATSDGGTALSSNGALHDVALQTLSGDG